jgi:hypothetical protein
VPKPRIALAEIAHKSGTWLPCAPDTANSGLIIYGYATGVFSSRKLERATYESVACRFIAANEHPDHDTIATFRRRFLKQIERLVPDESLACSLYRSSGDPGLISVVLVALIRLGKALCQHDLASYVLNTT